MRIEDDRLLAQFRLPGRCEWCWVLCPKGRDPAHVFSRGAGRLDVRINLASLCRKCHRQSHAGCRPNRQDLLAIVGRREKTTPEEIEAEIYRLRKEKS